MQRLEVFRGMTLWLAGRQGDEEDAPLTVFQVNDRALWSSLRPRRRVAGFFLPSYYGAYMVGGPARRDDDAERTLFHEYVHYLLRSRDRNGYPEWVEEGLAEVLGNSRFRDGRFRMGMPPAGFYHWLRQAGPLKSSRVVEGSVASGGVGFYYTSWALMHYFKMGPLMGEEDRSAALERYLQAFHQGEASGAAFKRTMGLQYVELSNKVMHYAKRGVVHLDFPVEPTRVAVEVTSMSPADTNTALGELFFVTAGPAAAAPYLEESLAHDPNNPRALSKAALADAEAGRWQRAEQRLDAALGRAPEDPVVLADGADFLARWLRHHTADRAIDDGVLQLLKGYAEKSAGLDGRIALPLMVLGDVEAWARGHTPEALAYYVRALERMPWHITINAKIGDFLAQSDAPHLAPHYLKKVAAWGHGNASSEWALEQLLAVEHRLAERDTEMESAGSKE